MDERVAGAAVRSEGAKELARYLQEEIGAGRLRAGVKLPPERELSQRFGASRGSVRRVLADLRERGLIRQSVGSGTFVSDEAESLLDAPPAAVPWFHVPVSPAELMEARRLIEPLLPPMIARNATAADFAAMQHCIEQSEAATTIEDFEHWDGALHKSFALATHNAFFMQILELTNRAREQGEWGRLKRNSLTPQRRAEYEQQHRAIVDALRDRDAAQAAVLMTGHLEQIRRNLFGE
ncbi:FadR/GntR family transcriptional regulator [Achromobacter aloeverae]|uniref:FadR/GntR family transcriptional regulator n=1 Tax=Achromobacter aloeverae TaxID=1750518 RepID=UPI001F02982F|nr:FCD domain-containing protein [Achromobacter aloeverae]